MKSSITDKFRRQLDSLSPEIQQLAYRAFSYWLSNPYHPSLQFKQVSQRQPIYSVRIGLGYRALGLWKNDTIFWYWIGSHAEYDNYLKQL